MSTERRRILRIITVMLAVALVLVLTASPDIATAEDWNRGLTQTSGQRSIEQVRSLPNTNGNVHFVTESDQSNGGAEENRERKVTEGHPEAHGTEQRAAVGGEIHWALQGENVAVGEAQQIAKFADKVSRKGPNPSSTVH